MSWTATRYQPFKTLIAGAAFALASLATLSGSAFADNSPHPKLHVHLSDNHPDILVMVWKGPVENTMADQIQAAFTEHKDHIRGVAFKLNSGGGSVFEGERVIAVLQQIKKTTPLHTVVEAGAKCGSMCVFIYVQGQKRLAAPASLWLFHEVSHKDPHTHQVVRLDRVSWEKLVEKYWVPAGVDAKWIDNVKTHTVGTNYWESGDSLLQEGANIIQKPLSDEQRRIVHSASTE